MFWNDTVTNVAPDFQNLNACGDALLADARRYPNAKAAHAGSTAQVQWTSSLGVDASLASWGLDDIAIWVQ